MRAFISDLSKRLGDNYSPAFQSVSDDGFPELEYIGFNGCPGLNILIKEKTEMDMTDYELDFIDDNSPALMKTDEENIKKEGWFKRIVLSQKSRIVTLVQAKIKAVKNEVE